MTRTLESQDQRDPPRLGFPDPLPVPPFSQGCQKEGEGDLGGPRWAEGSKPLPLALAFSVAERKMQKL